MWTLVKQMEKAIYLLPPLTEASQRSHRFNLLSRTSQGAMWAAASLLSLLSSPRSCSGLREMAVSDMGGMWLLPGRNGDETLNTQTNGRAGRAYRAPASLGTAADCKREIFLYNSEEPAWLLARRSQNYFCSSIHRADLCPLFPETIT